MATLIKNCLLYDGTGHPAIKADILIKGEKIEKIGTIPTKEGRVVIDAMGFIATPGFIDIGVRMDDYQTIFSERHAVALLSRGITTVIGGMYGESLAPFSASCINKKLHLRCTHPASRDWEAQDEFFGFLERYRPPLNFGTLVGYHTVRNCISKNLESDPSQHESRAMLGVISDALDSGAFGVSFDMKIPQGSQIPKKSLMDVAELVGTRGGVISITAEENESAEEILKKAYTLSDTRGVSVEVGRLSESKHDETENFKLALAKLEKKKSSVSVHFDVSATGERREEPFVKLLPQWAHEKNLETMLKFLKLSSHRARLVTHFKKTIPEETQIGEIAPHLSFLRGKSLLQIAESHAKTPAEILVRLISLSGLRGTCVFSEELKIDFLAAALSSPLSLISSHCASPYGGVETLVSSAEKVGYPLETLISKYTLGPAKKFRIPDRGIIKEGYFADIALFDADKKISRVFINGACAYADGMMPPLRPGHVIRRA